MPAGFSCAPNRMASSAGPQAGNIPPAMPSPRTPADLISRRRWRKNFSGVSNRSGNCQRFRRSTGIEPWCGGPRRFARLGLAKFSAWRLAVHDNVDGDDEFLADVTARSTLVRPYFEPVAAAFYYNDFGADGKCREYRGGKIGLLTQRCGVFDLDFFAFG